MTLPVFLVEDDPAIRDQLIAVIDHVCDAQVVGTEDTQSAAVDWMVRHPHQWDLAVVDLFLREGTGFGILERLPKAVRNDRVVVLTNSATAENRERCLALGACAVFDKTAELSEFLQHCQRLVSSHRVDKHQHG